MRPATRRAPRPPPAAPTLILLNKPYGVVSQFSRTAGGEAQRTLADYVPVRDVYPAGRLDADSEGLVLLTDDGALQARISDPRHKLPKIYWVEVEGTPDDGALRNLREGVLLRDGRTRPAGARRFDHPPAVWPRDPPVRFRRAIPTTWLALTLHEGRNRQVRRMTAAVGFPTLRLIRYAVGPWTIASLGPGEWRRADADLPGRTAVL